MEDYDMTEQRYSEILEGVKSLVYAIAERAYKDVEKYYKAVTAGKNRITGYADYKSSIIYFTKPHVYKSITYPSYFKYQMSLVGNDGDYMVKKILSSVLKMEKDLEKLEIAI